MILLAGCSGGGGTASPTDTATPGETADGDTTPVETTDGDDGADDGTDDGTDGQDTTLNASEAFSNVNTSESFSDATEIEMTLYNGSQQSTVLVQNNTNTGQELYEINAPDTQTTMYSTEDYAAIRNGTSGEIQYEAPDGRNASGVRFSTGFFFLGGFIYIGLIDWQEPSQTTIDGESVYVIEGNSLNQSAFDEQNFDLGFDPDNVQSVTGRTVITTDGEIRSINTEITTADETYGVDLSASTDQPSITKPDWVDESQAPN
jgi:hypothetical protein